MAAILRGQVDNRVLLAPVQPLVERGRAVPGPVGAAWRLHLQHLESEAAEQRGTQRAGPQRAHVQHQIATRPGRPGVGEPARFWRRHWTDCLPHRQAQPVGPLKQLGHRLVAHRRGHSSPHVAPAQIADLQPGGNRLGVAGAGQRHCQHPVGRRRHATRSSHRHGASSTTAHQGRPLPQKTGGIGPQPPPAQLGDVAHHAVEPLHPAPGGQRRWPVLWAAQAHQPRLGPNQCRMAPAVRGLRH